MFSRTCLLKRDTYSSARTSPSFASAQTAAGVQHARAVITVTTPVQHVSVSNIICRGRQSSWPSKSSTSRTPHYLHQVAFWKRIKQRPKTHCCKIYTYIVCTFVHLTYVGCWRMWVVYACICLPKYTSRLYFGFIIYHGIRSLATQTTLNQHMYKS